MSLKSDAPTWIGLPWMIPPSFQTICEAYTISCPFCSEQLKGHCVIDHPISCRISHLRDVQQSETKLKVPFPPPNIPSKYLCVISVQKQDESPSFKVQHSLVHVSPPHDSTQREKSMAELQRWLISPEHGLYDFFVVPTDIASQRWFAFDVDLSPELCLTYQPLIEMYVSCQLHPNFMKHCCVHVMRHEFPFVASKRDYSTRFGISGVERHFACPHNLGQRACHSPIAIHQTAISLPVIDSIVKRENGCDLSVQETWRYTKVRSLRLFQIHLSSDNITITYIPRQELDIRQKSFLCRHIDD